MSLLCAVFTCLQDDCLALVAGAVLVGCCHADVVTAPTQQAGDAARGAVGHAVGAVPTRGGQSGVVLGSSAGCPLHIYGALPAGTSGIHISRHAWHCKYIQS